ncbi:MAG TPA: A24 family peptidase [Thermoanaerobaculales bacterium]|nr:A24 family peptidase [Thermoanaerobaculales bacterium]HQN95655.1 A24 family peptidase [Thermoanaerobaculales bacterium]HQP44151.1 A24 family peptidase [Thermoanaerobaculales bacterium]
MASWPQPLVIVYALAVGAVVGSFLNVLIWRVPRGMSIIRPGSHCPACGAAIRWFDNVPILSWLALGGRCRRCRGRISLRYPVVEAAAGLLAVAALLRYGLSLPGLEALLFSWTSLALGLIDLEHQILPDVMTYPAIAFGLLCSILGGLTTFADALLGMLAGAAVPALVIVLYKLVRGIEGMGWGDVKYLAAIGAVVGLRDCLWVLVVAAVLGALVGLALILAGRGSGRTPLPFGSFLALAVIVWLYLPAGWVPAMLR